MKRSIIAGVAAAAIALPAAAGVETSIKVDYESAQLNDRAGAEAVYEKIKAAAEDVCRTQNVHERLRYMMTERVCAADAIDTAVDSIDSPQLTAVHQARG